jgi:hypothetical protein
MKNCKRQKSPSNHVNNVANQSYLVNSSINYSGAGSNNQSIMASINHGYRITGNPIPTMKQRGISISKSNREHKLTAERGGGVQ